MNNSKKLQLDIRMLSAIECPFQDEGLNGKDADKLALVQRVLKAHFRST
jgi:hypothetical protein